VSAIRTNPLFILAVLSLAIGASEWLCRKAFFRHIGSALMVIIFGAILANAGVIPANSTEARPVAIYDIIFSHIAPVALFWLLLSVNLRSVLKAGIPLIALFVVGSAGTMLGAVVAMHIVNGPETVGPLHGAIAGMFTGTYIGGSVNFNAVALHYGVMRDPALYGGSVVVDNIITTIWIVVTLAAPRFLAPLWPRAVRTVPTERVAPIIDLAAERETVDPSKIAWVISLGAAGLWVSQLVTQALASFGVTVPTILVVTAIALILAQVPAISTLPGARAVGMYAVYLFLAVIGAFCDVRALRELGTLGFVLLGFAGMMVAIHGLLTFGVARVFRMDLAAAAVASQANVGGATSALALAKSLGREDLLVPGILLGSLGNAIGTFLAFSIVSLA
jgi:uncharacterized membrane protein